MDLKKSKQIQCDFIYIFVTVTLQNNKQYLLTKKTKQLWQRYINFVDKFLQKTLCFQLFFVPLHCKQRYKIYV